MWPWGGFEPVTADLRANPRVVSTQPLALFFIKLHNLTFFNQVFDFSVFISTLFKFVFCYLYKEVSYNLQSNFPLPTKISLFLNVGMFEVLLCFKKGGSVDEGYWFTYSVLVHMNYQSSKLYGHIGTGQEYCHLWKSNPHRDDSL